MRLKLPIVVVIASLLLFSCRKDPNPPVGYTFENSQINVTTDEVWGVKQTTAWVEGGVITHGNVSVTENGVCWDTSHSPTMNNYHMVSGSGEGHILCNITGLVPGTAYYCRAYAISTKGVAYGNEKVFTTISDGEFSIMVSADPSDGGTVTGGGVYQQGQTCTVHATAKAGYTFTNWSEDGNQVSIDSNYTFTVAGNRTLVAHFTANPQIYSINVVASPVYGGSVTGGGNTYQQGQSCTVTATANNGYIFSKWTENSSMVSTEASYTFDVTGNRTLVAHFDAVPTWPNGVLPGRFSVSNTRQIRFSQGNLQYQASTDTWRFAENQYDYVGANNSNISQTYNGWIDLFGWGTSGYNHGATSYQPWSTTTGYSGYYAYGNSQYNLYDQTGQADWGYNPISNGGNESNQWRTLTQPEWDYVVNSRNTSSGMRFAKAKVNNVNGVILLPDDWNASTYSLSSTNSSGASFTSNTITSSQWATLENAGAVFLPAAGYRWYEVSVSNVGTVGHYWSASKQSTQSSYRVYFSDSEIGVNNTEERNHGLSVRLVQD